MTYRNPILLALAQLSPCCMVEGCGVSNHGQIVAMHSNRACDGKGMSMKASDAAIAFGCHDCHMHIDQGSAPIEIRASMWEAAHRATMRWLIESGHLIVNPETVLPQPPAPKVKAKIRSGGKLKSAGFPPADKRPKLRSGGRIATRRMGT